MIPQLLGIQQNQRNRFSPFSAQRIPYIRAGSSTASAQRHASVNGISRCAGCIVQMWFNTIQRVIGIWHIIDPGKMPSKVFQITRSRGTCAIPFIYDRNQTVQRGCIVPIVRIIKQKDPGLRAGSRHDSIVICCGCRHECLCCLRWFSHFLQRGCCLRNDIFRAGTV